MPRAARRAMQLCALVALVACGDAGPTGPVAVAVVTVTPSPASVRVDETVQLAATPKDGSGATLSDRTVSWTSLDASIATIVSSGIVSGVSEGSTTISAVADGTVGSVTVTVTPARVASVEVRPASPSLLIGETLQMTATPKSSAGTALPGRTVTWSTSDAQKATVSSSGLVEALASGPVTITATIEATAGTSSVEVVDPTAPRLSAVTPFPMVEGQAATITGVNFGATAGDNAVTVDGVAAAVTVADATSITFTVPTTGCRPLRDVSVRVTAAGKSGARMHPLSPAAFTQVGIGDQLVLPAACLQLDATNAFETYLVGVHSISASASSLLSAQLTGRVGLSASGSALSATSSPSSTSLWGADAEPAPTRWSTAAGPWPTVDDVQVEALRLHTARHVEARSAEAEALRAESADFSLAAAGALQSVIPPNPQVGDAFQVRVPPPFPGGCTATATITAQLRVIGNRSYWLVDQNAITSSFTDAELQQLADEFEDRVAPTLEATFGPIPDTDSDGHVAFVVTPSVNQAGWLSFASLYDYRPVAGCAASNEGDWAYVATPQPTSQSFTRSFLLQVLPHSLAHDFTHVIQNRVVIAANDIGARLEPWIEEGQATLGEEVYAHAIGNPQRAPRQNYGSSLIFAQVGSVQPYRMVSGLALYFGFQGQSAPKVTGAPQQCTWLQPSEGGTPPGPCDPGAAPSGAWAFLRWLTDHFGAAVGGDGAFHQALIDGAGSGFERVETLAGLPIETLLARFGAALYVDDRISLSDALLDFPSWDLFDLDQSVFDQGRLTPRNLGYQDLTENVSVRGASTAYFLVSGPGRPATAFEFTGATGGALSPDLQVWVVRVE